MLTYSLWFLYGAGFCLLALYLMQKLQVWTKHPIYARCIFWLRIPMLILEGWYFSDLPAGLISAIGYIMVPCFGHWLPAVRALIKHGRPAAAAAHSEKEDKAHDSFQKRP